MTSSPIEDYALISDCHSAALVRRDGSIEWLCMPRFDKPSIFGRLLDDEAGHWSVRPADYTDIERRYVPSTMVLETTFRTPTGTVVLTDALAVGEGERGHDLGVASPHVLLRRITCIDGSVEVNVEYAPRPEYGLIHPVLSSMDGGVAARGGADVLLLSGSIPLQLRGSTAGGRTTLGEGQSITFALHHRMSWQERPPMWTKDEISSRLDDTIEAWRTWSADHQGYEGPWRDLVHQSGRVLQALTFRPTGAIVAAATTSLPEQAGGERNWDYRYTWVRDASLTLEALWVAACPDEVTGFFSYMAGAAASQLRRGAHLQIMFGVGGEHDLSERELPHLSGWRGSRPVRVGNGAWNQRQLDVYGELLNAAYRLAGQWRELEPATRRFLVDLADAAAARWKEKDQGIWEVRGPPQDFLYSKLMCWVALDRAIYLAGRLGASDRIGFWTMRRDEIKAAILQRGWSERRQAFAQAFGSDELDASVLMMPIVGFVAPDDRRMLSTIAAIERHLTDDRGLVFRYKSHDGLEGAEGTFLLCTFWLAYAQALAGRVHEARATFERAIPYVNDLGLLAEEVDPQTNELLGNFPQAFSHIGLVNAAWAISQAEKGLTPGGQPLSERGIS
ncbi:MAG TPA: glycoside hydrolase family 15 protein [Actinomycetota bacterium]|jgi:GH15 family glucan-1,4-alpha-glucosidase|nr:glycoside hydrolase family 15 protein [Actinomycetota bacterium]